MPGETPPVNCAITSPTRLASPTSVSGDPLARPGRDVGSQAELLVRKDGDDLEVTTESLDVPGQRREGEVALLLSAGPIGLGLAPSPGGLHHAVSTPLP